MTHWQKIILICFLLYIAAAVYLIIAAMYQIIELIP